MIGFYCDGQTATLGHPITSSVCPAADSTNFGSALVNIPAPGTENDDKNPSRVKPRHLFDPAIGSDNLFHTDRVKWTGRFTVLNLTNKVAMYNFLSSCWGPISLHQEPTGEKSASRFELCDAERREQINHRHPDP